jgi:N-acetylmuramoyl-L-alanine amidase
MKNSNHINNYLTKKFYLLLTSLIIILTIPVSSQQVTGLSGWNIFLDPGHSQKENMGIYGYSEAEKNLRVALNLRQMLLDWTDIDTVYICRTNDQQLVSLGDRTTLANSLGASHYHSIHSDAASTSSPNSTLIMWGQLGIGGPEKTPYGGKKMSQIMVGLLTAGMRTTTRGAMGDRDFYGVPGSTPYLWVNRETNMASELSEAGFHTNPTQNQLNMNAEWKRLEAKTMYWTILKYKNVSRPFAGTVVGIIKDSEQSTAINGAKVSLNGQTYTTDTWASLFYKYNSNDTTFLKNGFYYFENIPAGTYQMDVTVQGYDPLSVSVTIADTFFTFKDVNLISNIPPKVISTIPAANDSIYPGLNSVTINFSRPMDRASVQSNLIITPSAAATLTWSNGDKTVAISTTNFLFDTTYTITIQGNAIDKYSHLFDGNSDGVGGDEYTFSFKTKVADVLAPVITEVYPSSNTTNVELKPVISVAFDEALKTSTISSRVRVVKNSDQTNAAYILRHYLVNGRSVLNFFITALLAENQSYTIKILPGIEDVYSNPTQSEFNYEFTTGNSNYLSETIIDNFESGIGSWWSPNQSGSTVGIISTETNISQSTTILNVNTGSTKSLQLDYSWDTSASNWLIREYRSTASPSFSNNTLLQAFIFGDGNNNKFRFALRETSVATPGNYEVSPWIDINWIGWRLITWDLSQGQTGNWLGNNILEPPFVFDSFQFTYIQGNASKGTYYFDDLRTASFNPTDVKKEDDLIPTNFVLEQNYPNPFNPITQIRFSIAQATNVKLVVTNLLGSEVATLVNDNLNSGIYTIDFNASYLSSGVYFYTLITDNFKQSKKMILMK